MDKNRSVYIPRGLVPRDAGSSLIQEGADNIDIDCQTLDGKGTFHCMARVVFQRQSVKSAKVASSSRRLIHGRSKSMSMTSGPNPSMTEVLRYTKPSKRGELPRTPEASYD